MCELQDHFQMMQSGQWAEINPSACRCRGTGWANSEVDTWHRCPVHGQGVPHPEAEDNTFDFAAHKHAMYVKAYTMFRDIARRNGFKGHFKNTAHKRLGLPGKLAPAAWVNAAEMVADEVANEAENARARSMGYESPFEMHMHEEAMIEQQERDQW